MLGWECLVLDGQSRPVIFWQAVGPTNQ
jgi:hypothetical protein